MGSVKGWRDLKTGNVIDLSCSKKKIIAEIKNKYSTISGGKLSELYYSLEKLVMPKASIYKGFTVYYVAIIPKKKERFNRLFTPPDKEKGEKCPSNEKIKEIDGASFYELVTGVPNALEQLFDALPEVINSKKGNAVSQIDKEKVKNFFNLAFE